MNNYYPWTFPVFYRGPAVRGREKKGGTNEVGGAVPLSLPNRQTAAVRMHRRVVILSGVKLRCRAFAVLRSRKDPGRLKHQPQAGLFY